MRIQEFLNNPRYRPIIKEVMGRRMLIGFERSKASRKSAEKFLLPAPLDLATMKPVDEKTIGGLLTPDQKRELIAHLRGSTLSLAEGMKALMIDGDEKLVGAQLADSIAQCGKCGRWVDAAIEEDGLCVECQS